MAPTSRPKAPKAKATKVAIIGGESAQSQDGVAIYLRDISRYPRLTRDEEVSLSKLALAGNVPAQEKLVTSNLKLVVSICKDFTRANFAILDLVSAGNEGLVVASRKYNATLGVPFANYAAYWIKQRVMKYVAEHGFTVRVPPYRAAVVNKVVRAHARLTAQMGRPPSVAEVAEETKHSDAEVAEVMQMMQPALELDATVKDGEGSATFGSYFGESTAEADARLDHTLRQIEIINAIKDALSGIPDRERNVIEWYYGLDGQPVTDLDEIARRLGVTRERARQIKATALKKLSQNDLLQFCQMDEG